MQVLSSTPKGSVEVLDYSYDFSVWMRDGDHIVGATVVADQPDLIVSAPLVTAGIVTVWLSGGSTGLYRLTCVAMTSGGRTVSRSALLQVA